MEPKPDDLRGMSASAAREYIFHYITSLKLSEKQWEESAAELAKWRNRAELARSRGVLDLAEEADREAARVQSRREALEGEIAELKSQIEHMRTQIPGLAARERSIDPDLLEQELRIVLGKTPGDDDSGDQTRGKLEALEADAALEALKARMGQAAPGPEAPPGPDGPAGEGPEAATQTAPDGPRDGAPEAVP